MPQLNQTPADQTSAQDETLALTVFAGSGEMCALMRSHNWEHTPLGPLRQWPQSLRTALGIVLNSHCPMFIVWGAERVMLYNDSYRPMLADKHPGALGRPAPETWPDFAETLGPIVSRVIDQGESVGLEPLPRWQHPLGDADAGDAEHESFACSYSPIRDESGGVGGLFCVCIEATRRATELPPSRLTQVLESLSDGLSRWIETGESPTKMLPASRSMASPVGKCWGAPAGKNGLRSSALS